MKNTGPRSVIVLGAGCTGLSAALELVRKGVKVTVLEKEGSVGGLGGSVQIRGNVYDYGPHLFHAHDPAVLKAVLDVAGEELFPIQRTILIKFLGKYFHYPLLIHDVIRNLPPHTTVHALASFLYFNAKAAVRKTKVETSETVLIHSYGKVLYELFFKRYIYHVWGIPASQFSPRFARQRIPQVSTLQLLYKFLQVLKFPGKTKTDADHYVENVEGTLYSSKRGFCAIPEKMAAQITAAGGAVRVNSAATSITRTERGTFLVTDSRGTRTEAQGLISTIPLDEAVRMVTPAFPASVLASAGSLKYRAVVFVGLLISKTPVLPAAILYFREHVFNRITDSSYFGIEVTPQGHSVLVAEISCNVGDPLWKDERTCGDTVVRELCKEGFITPEQVKEVNVFRASHAYPIYTLGFETHLETLQNAFESMGAVETTGRQGLFQYVNAHIGIAMGQKAAADLMKKMEAKQ